MSNVNRYKSKVTRVDAVQYDGSNIDDVVKLIGSMECTIEIEVQNMILVIEDPEGSRYSLQPDKGQNDDRDGDWLVVDTNHTEMWVHGAKEFKERYEYQQPGDVA